jgi:hypothetical protein
MSTTLTQIPGGVSNLGLLLGYHGDAAASLCLGGSCYAHTVGGGCLENAESYLTTKWIFLHLGYWYTCF